MAVGLATTALADKLLNTLSNTSFAAGATLYAKLHTGDPGAAGTANPSAETSRKALTWAAASGGSKAITGTGTQWTPWAAGAETITHVSVWDASTAGNFLYSFALGTPRAVVNGDTVTLNSHSFSLTPLAA